MASRYAWVDKPYHIIDLMATINYITGSSYPSMRNGNKIIKSEGISMKPAILGDDKAKIHGYIYWEHEGHCGVRFKDWKLVKTSIGGTWELYDLSSDRTERFDLAAKRPDLVKQLAGKWQIWAVSHQVFPKGKGYKDNTNNPGTKYAN